MPRARSIYRETAAAPHDQGSGCFPGFLLPPLAVIIISLSLASFAIKTPALEPPPASARGISPVFTAEVQHWASSISQWAAASRVDPNLAAAVMQIESCGDPRARSSAGAMGLFQVMPFHFSVTDSPISRKSPAIRAEVFSSRKESSGARWSDS